MNIVLSKKALEEVFKKAIGNYMYEEYEIFLPSEKIKHIEVSGLDVIVTPVRVGKLPDMVEPCDL